MTMSIMEHNVIGFSITKEKVTKDSGDEYWVFSIYSKDNKGHRTEMTYFTKENLTHHDIKGFDNIKTTRHDSHDIGR